MTKTPLEKKSSVNTMRERFDKDVKRFSDLEIAQQAVVDAPVMLELISKLAVAVKPDMENLLDIGCGGGNNAIAIIREEPGINCDLVDISLPMLERAKQRLEREHSGKVNIFHGDFRNVSLPNSKYDVVVAAAVLHHLRDDADWANSFKKIYGLIKPGGAFFISDIVDHAHPAVHNAMWDRYGDYLETIDGPEYRDKVF